MMNQVRFGRQSAIRIFAQEYSDANLPLEGVGEYAPSFIITKLGAKVNRALFGGVIDRFERREGDNGPTYSGHLRDATGGCLLYTSPSPRDRTRSRMPSSA